MIPRTNLILSFLGLLLAVYSCEPGGGEKKGDNTKNYRQEMRDFVIGISSYARNTDPDFIVIPQNGIELICVDCDTSEDVQQDYLNAIDGIGQEDLYYGYENDNEPSPEDEINYLKPILDRAHVAGKVILVTDYCSKSSYMDHSYNINHSSGYISFAADQRGLNDIPSYPLSPYNENSDDIDTLSQAKNFLYLIDCNNYTTKESFLNALKATNYDILIIDLFFNDGTALTKNDIESLKRKANNGKRKVISYLSIGEAENYRYYWQSDWLTDKPEWLQKENPDWPGDYKVNYWDTNWQSIIYGNDSSYVKLIQQSGFDGVYLDIIDGYEYFEESN
jgi:cysteinyl-tRNA synthetase, unknown class